MDLASLVIILERYVKYLVMPTSFLWNSLAKEEIGIVRLL